MASTMAQVCQIVGVMVTVYILTVSAAGCTDDAGCTHGEICWKMSDCTQGGCTCPPNWRKDSGGNCVEATTLLSEGDTCSAGSKTDVCDAYDDISCSGCPEDVNTLKCRSGSTTLRLSILTAISPIIIALFI